MKRTLFVLVREYLENVRTKAFLIGVVLTPLWFGLVFLAPLLAESQEPAPQAVSVVDETDVLGAEVAAALGVPQSGRGEPRYVVTRHDVPADGGEARTLVERLRGEAAAGHRILLLLTPPVLEKRPAAEGEVEPAIFHAASASAFEAAQAIQAIVTDVVNRRIMAERGIDPEDARLLERKALAARPLSRTGAEGGVAEFLAPLVFMLFLFMGIVGMSQMLVNSTIEEKTSRVYEVLLSSVSPVQLLAGKLLGICAVGFTLIALWGIGGLAAATVQGVGDLLTGTQVALFVAYYVLGFLCVASLMMAVGSACNTLKEAQNLTAPLSMLLALPLLLALVVIRSPHGTVATVGSFVPPFIPFVMMARVGAVPGPPAWQIWASLLLLAVSTWLAVRVAARVFRVAILLYGKPPRIGEILRWLRA